MKRKNQNKNLYLRLSLLLSLLISTSCSSIKQIDKPVCVEINLSKAFCTYTISNKDFIIDDEHPYQGKTWFELRPTMILIPVESWASFKKYLIKECKITKRCGGMIEGWDRTIKAIDTKLEEKGAAIETPLP